MLIYIQLDNANPNRQWKEDDDMGTVIVAAVLVVIVGLIVGSMVKSKKAGKSIQCGGDCKNCGVHCH